MPKFRLKQAEEALFFAGWNSWQEVSTLSFVVREALNKEIPWMTVEKVAVLKSKDGATYKAVVKALSDGERFETVLMKNARGHWSVCVSSQVGCAMRCTFCATGKMGLIRNLTSDEIVDQYRFWKLFLFEHPDFSQVITNIVFMGMGEPLNNYENVREALQQLLAQTEMGPTRMVVSTVGLVPMLHNLLNDPMWPPVRLAVSLHSADPKVRQEIMPTSYPDFLQKLAEWAREYFDKFDSRRRHVTFEYIMLEGVNDTPEAADLLARFANQVGKVRINLIPYNTTASKYKKSAGERVQSLQNRLEAKGVTVTKRRTMGDDIAAACGQLVTEGK